MNPDMQKELLARLDALAAKMGTTAAELWQIYMRQAHVAGVQDAFVAALSLIVGIGLTITTVKSIKWIRAGNNPNDNYHRNGRTDYIPTPVAAGIFALIAYGFSLGFLLEAYSELVNPAFWAFRHIVDAIR